MNHKRQTQIIELCCKDFFKSFDTDSEALTDNIRSRVYSFHETEVTRSFEDMKVFFSLEFKRLGKYCDKYGLDVNYLFKILFS